MSVTVFVVGEVDVKVIYIDAVRLKKLLDKYNDVTLETTEVRVDTETGRVTLNKKREKNTTK